MGEVKPANDVRDGELSDSDDDMAAEEDISSEELSDDVDPSGDDDVASNDGSESDVDDPEDDVEGDDTKSGWADAMAKVLSIGKSSAETKKPLLLSKAKKDVKVDEESKKKERLAVRKALKRERDDIGRLKPNVVRDRAKERRLAKLATAGVVQLFNAVRDQQKTIKSKLADAGQSTRKREKVFKSIDKDGFLDVLAEGSKKIRRAGEVDIEVKEEATEGEEESTWKILRDDFMMGAKLKDWDRQSDSEG